jgi:uncharacterized protein (UPF0297 family)
MTQNHLLERIAKLQQERVTNTSALPVHEVAAELTQLCVGYALTQTKAYLLERIVDARNHVRMRERGPISSARVQEEIARYRLEIERLASLQSFLP